MLKNKIALKRLRNVIFLGLILIIMLGIYNNTIRNSKAEDRIQIIATMRDPEQLLVSKDVTLDAVKNEDGTYSIQLTNLVDGKKVTKYWVKEGEEVVAITGTVLTVQETDIVDNKIQINLEYDRKVLTSGEQTLAIYNQTLSASTVTVSGYVPERATLNVQDVDIATLSNITLPESNVAIEKAYDIEIDNSGVAYEPNVHGETVSVAIAYESTSGNPVVYHVLDDNSVTKVDSTYEGRTIKFTASEFSVYLVAEETTSSETTNTVSNTITNTVSNTVDNTIGNTIDNTVGNEVGDTTVEPDLNTELPVWTKVSSTVTETGMDVVIQGTDNANWGYDQLKDNQIEVWIDEERADSISEKDLEEKVAKLFAPMEAEIDEMIDADETLTEEEKTILKEQEKLKVKEEIYTEQLKNKILVKLQNKEDLLAEDQVTKTGVKYTVSLSNMEQTGKQIKTETAGTENEEYKQYLEWSGNVSLKIAEGTLTDVLGNVSVETIIEDTEKVDRQTVDTTDKMFRDVIAPEIIYRLTMITEETDKKTLTVMFDVVDKYFDENSTLTAEKISLAVDGIEDVNSIVSKTLTKLSDLEETVNGTVKKVGERYQLVIDDVQNIKLNDETYYGPIQLMFAEGSTKDTSENGNIAKTITIMSENNGENVADTVADTTWPVWQQKGTATVNSNTVEVTLQGTDAYLNTENSSLTAGDIRVYVQNSEGNFVENSNVSKDLSDKTVNENSIEYTLTLGNFGTYSGKIKLEILAETLVDTSENVNDVATMILQRKLTSDDWRIFYTDGNTVYAILADYLPAEKVPAAANLDTDPTNYPYSVWSDTNRDTLLTGLTTTSYWNSFANGIEGATATGSPTGEQLMQSYNTKNGTTLDYKTYPTLDSSTEDYDLYVPHTEDVDRCYGYWLASPVEFYAYNVWGVDYSGCVDGHDYEDSGYGGRPLVSLPSNIPVTKEGDIWQMGASSSTEETLATVTNENIGDYIDLGNDVIGTATEDLVVDFDSTKPVWEQTDYNTNTTNKTITINLSGTDENLDTTNSTLTTENIKVYINDVENTEITKVLSEKTVNGNAVEYTLTLGKLDNVYGTIKYEITARTLKDTFNNESDFATLSITENDWRIFYNDGENVFLIADDYALNSKFTDTITELDMTTKGNYSVYWNESSNYGYTINPTNKYMISQAGTFTSSNINYQAVGSLLDTTKWTYFSDSNGNGDYTDDIAESAIGSPTLEMFVASWNEIYGEQLYCNNVNAKGYFFGTTTAPTSYGKNISSLAGYGNTLYFPHASSYNLCSGYWLASPSAGHANFVFCVYFGGGVFDGYYYYEDLGCRPVVMLKTEALGTKNSNNVWSLSTTKGNNLADTITSANYGDYVNYPIDIDNEIEKVLDFVSPKITYQKSGTSLNGSTLTVQFSITDDNFESSTLGTGNIAVVIDGKNVDSVVEKNLTESDATNGKIYTLEITNLNQVQHSGTVQLVIDGGVATDTFGNTSLQKTISVTVGENDEDVIIDFIKPVWEQKGTAIVNNNTVEVTLQGTDSYLNTENSELTAGDIRVYVQNSEGNFVENPNVSKELSEKVIAENSIEYTLTLGNFRTYSGKIKLEILAETLVDTSENVNDVADLTLQKNKSTDWKIFYNDGENVFLIASDYVLNSKFADTITELDMYTYRNYSVYWKSSALSNYDYTISASNKYMISQAGAFTSSNPNYQAVGSLLDTTMWRMFSDTNGNGNYTDDIAESAIGSPTLEMFVASVNNWMGNILYCNNTNSDGYYLGTTTAPTNTSVDLSNVVTLYGNTLYFPHKSIYNNCWGYWLASPSANGTLRLCTLRYDGYIFDFRYDSYDGPPPRSSSSSNVKNRSIRNKNRRCMVIKYNYRK